MPEQQQMFTEEEFDLLHESLELRKEKAKKYVEYSKQEMTAGDSLDGLLNFLKSTPAGKDIAAKMRNENEKKLSDSNILIGKLEQMKRWQRQQGAQSTTTTQA